MIFYIAVAAVYCITAIWFQKMLKEEIRKDPTISNPTSLGWSIGVFIASFFWFLFVVYNLLFDRGESV